MLPNTSGLLLIEAAESEPVPPQEPPFRKSKAVIVLQLLKRWRNVQYDTRSGRRPPSILIAKLVADAANHTNRLSEELLLQARHMLEAFRSSHKAECLIHVTNPVCEKDVLTDRWPGSLEDQAVFIKDLETLVGKVEKLASGCDLKEMKAIMVDLFGEAPTTEVFRSFNEGVGSGVRVGQSQYCPGTGSLVVPSTAAGASVANPSGAVSTPKHSFYGE